MAFKKMTKPTYPPRLWALVGYPGSGKSTFATQMQAPLLAVDADHRFGEVVDLAAGDVFQLSDSPADQVDADRIAAILAANMPGSGVRTVVIDSLTAIITPLVVQAMIDKDAGREKNLAAAFRKKALAMRQLQDAVTRWGVDTLWIYHLNDARDERGRELVKATVSETELARLTRSINLQLEIVQDQAHRGVKVVWARRGRSGTVLWDDTGTWAGMPERIEAAVYDGLSQADQDALEGQAPEVFPTPETAISWGYEQGAFKALQHARNAYHKLKTDQAPATAEEMAALWVADVQARLLAREPTPEAHQVEGPPPAGDGGQDLPQAPLPGSGGQDAGDGGDGSGQASELDRYFPRGPEGGPRAVPNSPAALLKAITPEHGPHLVADVRDLFVLLREELGTAWSWPAASDVDGWRRAWQAARDVVQEKV